MAQSSSGPLVSWVLTRDGELGAGLSDDSGDSEDILSQFAKSGIDIDTLAARLQDDGAKSFVKPWNELMDVIASKGAQLKKAS